MSQPLPGPDQFVVIAGAPRSGTTALSDYLKAHPAVCFSTPKEPHYFTLHDFSDTDDATLKAAMVNDYIPRYFGHCLDGATVMAEGSVSYLYTPKTAAQILRIWPDAKFILCVRDPMSLVPSLHQRSLYQGDETIEDFRKAWELTAARARGEAIPRSCLDPRLLRYDEVGMLGKYLKAFFDELGRRRCHVVVYDDIVEQPARVIARLRAFIGLADDGQRRLPRSRAARGYRWGWLQRLLKRPPRFRSVLAGWHYRQRVKELKPTPPAVQVVIDALIRLHGRLLDFNRLPAPPVEIQEDLRKSIREHFLEDVGLLSELLQRDLSHWLSMEPDTTAQLPKK